MTAVLLCGGNGEPVWRGLARQRRSDVAWASGGPVRRGSKELGLEESSIWGHNFGAAEGIR